MSAIDTRSPALRQEGGVDLRFVRDWFARYWLAIWFGVVSATAMSVRLTSDVLWFFDARLYVAAARAWLTGADPWAVSIGGDYFAAPPPTLLVLAPFAIPGGEVLLMASVIAGAIATIRVLHLPWWWLLFPPLIEAVVSGNIQTWLIPLILWRSGPVAVLAKVYAIVPLFLLDRRKAVIASGLVLLLTIPILPWGLFLENLPVILGYYTEQSTYRLPLPVLLALAPFGLWALWRVGRERGAWLVVPAFAGYQWYYATFVMVTGSWLTAAVAAVPVAGSGLLALFALSFRSSTRSSSSRG